MSGDLKGASLFLRAIAKSLDLIIIAAAAEVIPKAGFFAGLAYLLIGDGLFDGRSFGKKIIGLRVVSKNTDKPCTFRDSILRNSMLGLGYLFYKLPWFGWIFVVIVIGLEFVVLLGSKDGMRLGDEIAKTRVITVTSDTETLTGG